MKQDITSYNEKGQQHGYWEVYDHNGKLVFKGNYVDNNEVGWFLINYYDTYYKFFFKNGEAYYKNRRFSFYSF